MSTITDCVDLGAEFLTGVKPGWENEINLDKLDLYDLTNCVLAQLFGGYIKADPIIGSSADFRARHGFTYLGIHDSESWEQLTEAWKTKIMEMRMVLQTA